MQKTYIGKTGRKLADHFCDHFYGAEKNDKGGSIHLHAISTSLTTLHTTLQFAVRKVLKFSNSHFSPNGIAPPPPL